MKVEVGLYQTDTKVGCSLKNSNFLRYANGCTRLYRMKNCCIREDLHRLYFR